MVRDRRFEPHSGLQVSKKQNASSPLTRRDSILWGAPICDREVACLASDRQGSNFESFFDCLDSRKREALT